MNNFVDPPGQEYSTSQSNDQEPSRVSTNYLKKINFNKKPKKPHLAIIAGLLVLFGTIGIIGLSNQDSDGGAVSNNILGTSVESLMGGGELSDEDVIKKVGKLTYLPQDEIPEIATVADVNELNHQVFFQKSQTGDKVLIYHNAKRVILYRPEDNKIVETAPLVEASPTPELVEVDEQ